MINHEAQGLKTQMTTDEENGEPGKDWWFGKHVSSLKVSGSFNTSLPEKEILV